MEGPDVDWKIEEAESDVEWILEKGLILGKKVVVTGFVISSAPLILPSIVIVSALGFVVSIPFGLVFASYVCSQKLMNTLLPMPTASSMLEHEKMVEHQDEEEEEEEEQDAKGSGAQEVDMEEEEKGGIENSGEGTEKRIESVGNESKLPPATEGNVNNEDVNDISRDDEERMANDDESVENKGYEEDVGENLQGDEKKPEEVIDVKIEGEGEGEEEEAEKGPIEEEQDAGAQEVDAEEEKKGGIENSEGTEKRIESVENESKLPPAKEGDGNDEDVNDISRDEEERMVNEDESVENKGYEEDVGENLQEEDEKKPEEAIDVKIEGEGEGEGEEAEKGPIEEESKDEEPLPEQEDQKGNAGDAEKKKKENEGGEEKSQVVEGKDDSTNVGTVKESENPVKNENDNGKTLDQGTTEEDNAKEPETNSGGQNTNGVDTRKGI